MPMVQRLLERMSAKAVRAEVPVDEAVAAGAAIHAAICVLAGDGRVRELSAEAAERLGKIRTVDVAAHALGLIIKDVRTLEYRNDVLIAKNSRLPASVTRTYQTSQDGQTKILLQVVQGDAPDPSATIVIGQLEVAGLPPGRAAGSLVNVTYSYDRKGRIHVRAEDQDSGKVVSAEIARTSGLRASEVAEEAKRLGLKTIE
jgi:molecular chaperone DnaK (HSP70)